MSERRIISVPLEKLFINKRGNSKYILLLWKALTFITKKEVTTVTSFLL